MKNKIQKAIFEFAVKYATNRKISLDEINRGHCFIFAYTIYKILKNKGFDVKLHTCVDFGGHACIEIDGKCYDSKHSWGEDSIEKLMQETLEEEAITLENIRKMEQWEFFEYWTGCGFHSALFNDVSFMRGNAVRFGKIFAKILKEST